MNKNTVIKGVLLVVFILLACFLIYKRYLKTHSEPEEVNKNFTMKVINNQNNELVNIMGDIYYYNVTANVTMEIDNMTHSLEEALRSELLRLDDILISMNENEGSDGVTYTPKKDVVTEGSLVITKCTTENKNIIISNVSQINLCRTVEE